MQGKRKRYSEEEAGMTSFKWSLSYSFGRYANTQKEQKKSAEMFKKSLQIHSEELCFCYPEVHTSYEQELVP